MFRRPWHAFYPSGLAPRASYPPIPVWGLLERAARRFPQKPALVQRGRRIPYGELRRRALAVAGGLRAAGLAPGDRVLIRLPNGVEFVEAYFGTLYAGGVAVPASPAAGTAALDALRADAAAAIEIGPGELPAPAPAPDPDPSCGSDLAVLQYTSGTTGGPKGAEMTHANLVANAYQNARWFAWTKREINLGILPLHHTWGLSTCLHSTFAVCGTLVAADRFDADHALDSIERENVTVLYGSATMFHRLLDRPARALPTLRHVKAGAMPTQGALKERWDAAHPHAPLQQGYGLTEAAPESHDNPPQRHKAGTVGIPLQDTDCRIVDPDDPGRVLRAGEAGEVCLRGPQVARGYRNAPEATAQAFHGGWLRTGDIGAMDGEGYLTIVDRKKDMLKFRGYTVGPNDVEACLLAHPAVAEAVVVGFRDERDGDVPVACVVLRGETTDAELAGWCRARLARYEVPRRFLRVEGIPRNAVGKPLRRVLRERVNRSTPGSS